MPLLAILDESAHAALDDTLKPLYQQNAENKQFYLDIGADEAAKLAFNLQAEKDKLKTNNAELLKQKGEANARLKEYEALGKTPDEIKQSLDANRPEETTKLIEKYEAEKKSLKDSYDEALQKETAARATLERQTIQTLSRNRIAELRLKHDLNETADFVLDKFIRFEPREEGSAEYVERVYDETGQIYRVAGEPVSGDQLIGRFREEKKFTPMFNGGTGGGTGASGRNTPPGSQKRFEGLSATERLKEARR